MSTGISLSGLASGLDTNTMVTQLMAIQRQRLTAIGYRQDAASAKKDGLNAVAGKLSALKTAADALKTTTDGTWSQTQVVESSDASKVVAAKIGGTGIGGHTIRVDRLASSAQLGFKATSATFAAGTLKIFSGTDPNAADVKSVSIDIKAGATLSDVATSINAASKSPVSAAVITDADGTPRLVLSSKATGSTGTFTVDTSALGNGELSADAAYTRTGPALDAQYAVDGGATLTSPSNTIENAIAGVRLTLKGVSTSPVTVTASAPDVDRGAITTKIKAFVDAYNSLLSDLDARTTQKPVLKPSSASEAQQGALYGDSGLTSLMSQLRSFASQALSGVSGGIDSLAKLGITVPKSTGGASSDAAKLGKLTVDDDTLKEALETDWTKVSAFFDAFAGKVDAFVRGYTGTGTAVLDGRIKSAGSDVSAFDSQIDDMNTRLDAQETRLRAQFAAMETAVAKAQSQQSWLTGQISKLNA